MTDRVTRANLRIRRHRTYRRNFTVLDENGAAADIDGYTARIQFRETFSGLVVFEGTTEDGVLQIAAGSSVVALEIPSSDTGAMDEDALLWDIELIDGSDRRIPLVEGQAAVLDVVTRT